MKTFVFSFAVSDEFIAKQPHEAARYIAIAKERIAKEATAKGPRGGTYLLVTPPSEWVRGADINDFIRGRTSFSTTRQGRYVRPSRAPVPLPSLTFEALTIPVAEGGVTLPDGRYVETTSRYVTVPVMA